MPARECRILVFNPKAGVMAVTIRHIATAAGVSPGTASRALRGHPQVSEECVARVRAAAARLGYQQLRDRSGRSRPQPLAGKRIAIVLFGIDRALASLPVVAEAIHGGGRIARSMALQQRSAGWQKACEQQDRVLRPSADRCRKLPAPLCSRGFLAWAQTASRIAVPWASVPRVRRRLEAVNIDRG